MIVACSCLCGGSESLVRNFLHSANYPNWMDIPIRQGKEKSLALINQLPPTPEKEMLQNFIKNSSKWAVSIGYNQDTMKWSDIAHNGPKSKIEATFIVENFSEGYR